MDESFQFPEPSPATTLAQYSTVCTCGRSFAQLNAYANHQRTCKKRKKYLLNALSKAKELWTMRKRPCREVGRNELLGSTAPTTLVPDAATSMSPAGEGWEPLQLEHSFVASEFSPMQATFIEERPNSDSIDGNDGYSLFESSHAADDALSLAERCPRRLNCRLPARYRDVLPQPPPPPMNESAPSPAADPPLALSENTLLSRSLSFFHTLPNLFGLSHQYYGACLLTHDPEAVTTLEHLTLTHSESDQESQYPSIPAPTMRGDCSKGTDAFYPYPNKSSFLLGDWFWNGGLHKSQKSFRELLQIISDTEFQQEDVRATHWNLINDQLGSQASEEDAEGWLPLEGAGWKKTAIKIKIPIHRRADNPGVHDYISADLHH
ncbi:hypothetical protein F4604DRAFT_1919636 [Suillus subluteus]|nr:hypothetical protein F4604DRAFT_1919636 [Suillus subluteus]